VTRSYYSRIKGENEYGVETGASERRLVSPQSIAPGSVIMADGEFNAESKLVSKKVEILSGAAADKSRDAIMEKIRLAVSVPGKPQLLPDDQLVRSLWPDLMGAASKMIVAERLRRSVMLRFHGDADGICGAFALTSVLHCKALQQNSAVYSVRDALRDISFIGQENRPFMILLDFGSSDACNEGLDILRAGGIEYIVIDHHPLGKSPPQGTISPFKIEDKASRYTAGYLGCEVAAALGFDKEMAHSLARIACAGDKSDILPVDAQDVKKAMVLDFLASHVSFGNNLDFYKNVMVKDELFHSIAGQAEESIEEAAQKAMAQMKASKTADGKLEIILFPLGKIVKRGEWPSSSKVTTRIFDKLRNERPESAFICLGYTERSVIIRLNDEAVSSGLGANALAEAMKMSMPDFVEGGGGHVKAGAIRVKIGFAKDVVNELLRRIEAERKG